MREHEIMDKKMIIIVTTVIVIILCFSLIRYRDYREPKRVFARILGFELPNSAEVLEHYYDSTKERFDAKILVNYDDIEVLKEGLLTFFGKERPEDYRYSEHLYIGSWWDLNIINVKSRYYRMVNGKKNIFGYVGGSTSNIWAYLVYSDDGEYYLYISKL